MKKAIIIGATSGIGRELALLFSSQNYEIGLIGRRTKLLEELSELIETKTYPLTLDINNTNQSIPSLEKLIQTMGGVDVIIITAGTGYLNNNLDWKYEHKTIETNVKGFTAMTNVSMKQFIKQEYGHLVGISSIASIRGSDTTPAYNASKAYISNYLEGLRIKVLKSKLPIYITDIQPGLINTAMAKGEKLFWVEPVPKAAKQIYNAIKRKKRKAYVTKRWMLIALLLKILPEFIYKKI